MSKTVKNFLNSREHMKNQMLDYLCIALGLMFYTIGWTCFLLPYKIVTGALTGLSAIVFYVTGIPIYQTYLTLNDALELIPMAIVAKNATFDSMTVPMEGAYSSRFVNGMAVLVPDMSKNVAAVAEFLNLPTADAE